MQAKTLYVCYFGMDEPLVQTQVLPYLRELGRDGIEVSLLTFERLPRPDEFSIKRTELAKLGIDWHWLRYHKRLSVLATAWDVFRGAVFIHGFVSREKPDVLHGRVHIPTLMSAIARRFSRRKPKLLFDIRGFMPEEYTDAGIWPKNGWLYRTAKRVEAWLLRESDAFVVLTERAREILFPESTESGVDKLDRPIEVIPCCVDLARFDSANDESRTELRTEYKLGERFVVAYVGAFGGWYLTEETADFFGQLKKERPDAFALILTQSPAGQIESLLRSRGYGESDLLVTRVDPAEVPRYLSAADAAVSFIKRCYSKQASSPTKNAEYLACGLPIVANAGVGDVDQLLGENRVGAIVHDLSAAGYTSAIKEIESLGQIGERCRRTARDQFDLESVGGARYRRLYSKLLGG